MTENKNIEDILQDLLKPTKETNVKILIDKIDDSDIHFSFAGSPYKFTIGKENIKNVMADIQTSLQEKARLSFQWVLIFYAFAELKKSGQIKSKDKQNRGVLKKLATIKSEALKFLRLRHKLKLNINKNS